MSKTHFYGRGAAEANFSDFLSALLPHDSYNCTAFKRPYKCYSTVLLCAPLVRTRRVMNMRDWFFRVLEPVC